MRDGSDGGSPQDPTPAVALGPPDAAAAFPGWDPSFQAALERLSLVARRPARGRYAGDARSRLRGRALEFADYRPYVPGDDPRLVDWRTYARLDRLYLKQYEEERARTLTLLVDASASLDWGEGEEHKGRYARRLAAALAWVSLCRHEAVRSYLLRDGDAEPLPPTTTRSGAAALFRRLGVVREAGRTSLAAAVGNALRFRAPGPTVLLSDLLDAAWVEALALLAGTGEGVVLQVLSPTEWEPPLGEEVELEDAETGELRPTRLGPAELAAYKIRLADFVGQVRAVCRRHGLLYVALDTGTTLREAVLRRLTEAGVLE